MEVPFNLNQQNHKVAVLLFNLSCFKICLNYWKFAKKLICPSNAAPNTLVLHVLVFGVRTSQGAPGVAALSL